MISQLVSFFGYLFASVVTFFPYLRDVVQYIWGPFAVMAMWIILCFSCVMLIIKILVGGR